MLLAISRISLLTLSIICISRQLEAAITVDPDNTGANDVTVNGVPLHLFNPLPDNLDLSGFDLRIGADADGVLQIDGGSHLVNQNSSLGTNGNANILIHGDGTKWITEQALTLGFETNTEIKVTEGARVESSYTSISPFEPLSPNSFQIEVSGDSTQWINQNAIVVSASEQTQTETNFIKILDNALLKTKRLRMLGASLVVQDSGTVTTISVSQNSSYNEFPDYHETDYDMHISQNASVNLSSSGKIESHRTLIGYIQKEAFEAVAPSDHQNSTSPLTSLNGFNHPATVSIDNASWHNESDFVVNATNYRGVEVKNSGKLHIGGELTVGTASPINDSGQANIRVSGYGHVRTDKLNLSEGGSVSVHNDGLLSSFSPYIRSHLLSDYVDIDSLEIAPTNQVEEFSHWGGITVYPFNYSELDINMTGGKLNVGSGGRVFSMNTTIDGSNSTDLRVDVTGDWTNHGDLTVKSLDNTKNFFVNPEGHLRINGRLTVEEDAKIQVILGHLHADEMDVDTLSRIFILVGTLSGNILLEGNSNLADISSIHTNGIHNTVKDTMWKNQGAIYGSGRTIFGLNNTANAVVNVLPNETMTFLGNSQNHGIITLINGDLNLGSRHDETRFRNSGDILNFGGKLEVDGLLSNAGLIRGNGTIRAQEISNLGEMEFIQGESHVYGRINNSLSFVLGDLVPVQSSPAPSYSTDDIRIAGIQNPDTNQFQLPRQKIELLDGANVTFHDSVIYSNTIEVASTATAIFAGGLQSPHVTGKGKVILGGDIRPHFNGFLYRPAVYYSKQDESELTSSLLLDPAYSYFPHSSKFEGDVELLDNATVHLTIAGRRQRSDGSSTGTANDWISVAESLTLDGTLNLNISPSDSFLPEETFTLITAGQLTGEFDAVYGLDLDGPLEWELTQTDTELFITAVLPGDFNNDWSVDAADFTLWRDSFTLTSTAAVAPDFYERKQAAYNAWLANYGVRFERPASTGLASAVSIPEPSSALLLLSLVAIASGKSRRS